MYAHLKRLFWNCTVTCCCSLLEYLCMCSGDLLSIKRRKFSVDHFSIRLCYQDLGLQGVFQAFYLCLFIFYFLEVLKLFLKNRIVYLDGIWARGDWALYHKISKCYICMTYYDGHQILPESSLIYLYLYSIRLSSLWASIKTFQRLEQWLGSEEHFPLIQRTQVLFPEHTPGGAQEPVT